MTTIQTFLFNSLTVSTGLLIYTFFLYLVYLLFFNKKEEEAVDQEQTKENDKIDNFDVLEDV